MKDLTCFEPKFKTLVGYIFYQELFPILEDVSNKTHVSITDICSESKKREYAEARHIFLKRAMILKPKIKPEYYALAINKSRAIGYYSWKNVDEIPSLRKKYEELYGI